MGVLVDKYGMRLGVQIAGCVFVCGVGSVRRAVRGGTCECMLMGILQWERDDMGGFFGEMRFGGNTLLTERLRNTLSCN